MYEVLEAKQLEEQHGFRPSRRLEEHLLTANLLLEKTAAAGITVWVVGLDLSKAFDRVHWPTWWETLPEPGVPEHWGSKTLVWLLRNDAYDEQLGEVMGEWGNLKNRSFSITGGVQQRCVFSPRLFRAVPERALRQWKTETGNAGFDLGDALDNLVDLRFADDIFFLTPFCRHKVSRRCLIGQLPGIGTAFILASLQMRKVQKAKSKHKVH